MKAKRKAEQAEAEQAAGLDEEVRADVRQWLSREQGGSNSLDYAGQVRAKLGMQERYAGLNPMQDRDVEQRRSR